MATFTPADITATTLEGALLQLVQLIQTAEQGYTVPQGETRQNRVQLSVNTDTGLATISATLPLAATVGAGGIVSLAATEYIPNA